AFEGADKVEVDPATGDLVLTLHSRESLNVKREMSVSDNSALSTQNSELPSRAPSAPSDNSELRTQKSELSRTATLRLQKPLVYQLDSAGHKQLVAGNYVVREASVPNNPELKTQNSEP